MLVSLSIFPNLIAMKCDGNFLIYILACKEGFYSIFMLKKKETIVKNVDFLSGYKRIEAASHTGKFVCYAKYL